MTVIDVGGQGVEGSNRKDKGLMDMEHSVGSAEREKRGEVNGNEESTIKIF